LKTILKSNSYKKKKKKNEDVFSSTSNLWFSLRVKEMKEFRWNSFGNPGVSGFGVVIRDSNSPWVFEYVGPFSITTNLNADIKAIYHELDIPWFGGF